MARREFPRAVKVAVIKRSTRDGAVYCEKCGALAKRWQIDHVVADAHGGEPVIENAELICELCFTEKNAKDTTIAAKLKRVEARHLGAKKAAPAIPRRPTEPAPAQKRASRPMTKTCAGMPALQRRFTNG